MWQLVLLSSKTKGPGEKGAPRNHPEMLSQKLADFECRCSYDSYGSDRADLFRRRILGQYPAAPRSPGPFVLLLISGKIDVPCSLRTRGGRKHPVKIARLS